MKNTLPLTLFLAAGTLLSGLLIAAPLSYTLPPETARFKSEPGSAEVMANCLTCHSAEYVITQPPLSRAAWKASVVKMQKVHGAPIPDAQVDGIAEYLARSYGDEKPASPKANK